MAAPETPRSPCLRSDMPPNSSCLHLFPDIGTVECIKQAVQKLVQALEKDTQNKYEDAKPKATKEAEAEKQKIRASKLDYKQVDKVYVTFIATTLLTFLPIVGILACPSIKS